MSERAGWVDTRVARAVCRGVGGLTGYDGSFLAGHTAGTMVHWQVLCFHAATWRIGMDAGWRCRWPHAKMNEMIG